MKKNIDDLLELGLAWPTIKSAERIINDESTINNIQIENKILYIVFVIRQGGCLMPSRGERGTMDTYFSFWISFKYICSTLAYYRQ